MNIREHEHDYYFLRTAARRSMAWDVQNMMTTMMMMMILHCVVKTLDY